ncbi:hypothetical protein LINGRAHAP2_LOCUS9812, partial [Linum grandiflorum]
QFHDLYNRQWEVKFSHTYRETNCGAHYLANFGHFYHYDFHFFNLPDEDLSCLLQYNLIGVLLHRQIQIYIYN